MSGIPPPPPPAPGPPPPPPPGGGPKKMPGAWRKKYRPPSSEASSLVDARTVFGDLPDAQLRLAIAEQSATGRVGLTNSGATCYMNSLLQALFHIGPFCAALYNYAHDPAVDGDPARSIPHQLSLLFAALACSQRKAVSTLALTRAFGWDTPQRVTQSDVQEFCRVLFDALDRSFARRSLPPPSSLFHFTAESFVHCSVCATHSTTPVNYLDLSLPTEGVDSLYAALDTYLAPELLTGDNQYACSVCDARVNAAKGIKILTFPPVLSLSLQRFTYSPVTWTKVKLNHAVVFPRFLDLARYDPANREAFLLSKIDHAPLDWEPDAAARAAPTTYALAAVLVHSGGSMGGHYYGYCATAPGGEPDEWIHFNDAEVAAAEWATVCKAYGHDPADESVNHTVGANAYMLLYVSLPAYEPPPPPPSPLAAVVAKANTAHAALLAQFKAASESLVLTARYGPASTTVQIPKAASYGELLALLLPNLGLADHPVDAARVRPYDAADSVAGPPFDAAPDTVLATLPLHSGLELVVETRSADTPFPPAESFTLTVLEFDPDSHVLAPPRLAVLDFADAAAAKAFTLADLCATLGVDAAVLGRVARGDVLEWLDTVAPDTPAITRLKIVSGASVVIDASDGRAASAAWLDALRSTVTLRLRGTLAPAFSAALGRDTDTQLAASRENDALIGFDLRKTVGDLKEHLAGLVDGLTVANFRLRLRRASPELAHATPLADLGLYANSCLFADRGTSVQPGQISLTLHAPNPAYDPAADSDVSFPFVVVADLVLDRAAPLADVKLAVGRALGLDASVSTAAIRIRELLGEKEARIFSHPDATLGDNLPDLYAKADHMDVVATVLDADDHLLPGHLLLAVHHLDVTTAKLSAPAELMLPPTATKAELEAAAAAALGLDCAVESAKLYFKSQTDGLAWDVDAALAIVDSPWYLRDGDAVAIRDAAAAAEAAAAAQLLRDADAASSSASGAVEVALRIHVQSDEEIAAYAALLAQKSEADAATSSS